jgi:hypothetical protein
MVVFEGEGLALNTIIREIQDALFRVTRCLKIVPFTHEDCLRLYWIQKRGSVQYDTNPMQIWGPCIKVLESRFGNPNPDPFALLLVQFADPDHVWIWNDTHFMF